MRRQNGTKKRSVHRVVWTNTLNCLLPLYSTLFVHSWLASIGSQYYSKVCALNVRAPTKPSTLDNVLCLDMENHVCPLVNKGKPQTKGSAARSGLSFWNQLEARGGQNCALNPRAVIRGVKSAEGANRKPRTRRHHSPTQESDSQGHT